jgi:PEP-CTERM motif
VKSAITSVGIILLGSTALLSPAHAITWTLTPIADIAVPASPSNTIGGKFAAFDISFFDPATGLDYVADRSNAAVDVFAAPSNTFATRIGGSFPTFAGALPPDPVGGPNSTSGPDGVQVVNTATQHNVFVGDGPSIVWNFSIKNQTQSPTFSQNQTVATGGQFRADEMAFDPNTNRVLVANNADGPAFATLIDATTGKAVVVGPGNNTKIIVPAGGTTGGLEASDINPVTKTFFVAVPQLAVISGAKGGVAEIDPVTGAVKNVFNLQQVLNGQLTCGNCSPTGLAAAKNGQMLIGDGNTGPGSGAIIIDPTGKVIATFPNVNGIDQVWYDPTTNKWFLAAGNNAVGGVNVPELVIIDAATDMISQIIKTTPGDHSVSVDPITGEIFVPFAANAANTVCPNGCIAVFAQTTSAVPEPSTWAMMLLGFLGLAFAFRTKRRVLGVA